MWTSLLKRFQEVPKFQNLRKFELGHCPQPPLKKNFYTKSEYLFIVISAGKIRHLPRCINFWDINGVLKLGPRTIIRDHSRRSKSGIIGFYGYVFLLVIHHICTRGCTLHRFRDIAFNMSNVATPLAFNPRRRGYPGTIFVKFCTMFIRWPRYKMA